MHEAWRHPELIVPDLVCVAVCLVATATDIKARRIPNWLTLPAVVAGLLLNTLLPALSSSSGVTVRIGLVSSVTGGMLLLLTFGFLGFINFVGMGDVKLMAAVGTLLRWPTALWALAYVAIMGGAIAVAYTLAGGRLGAVFGNLVTLGRRLGRKEKPAVELHRIPYALAVLLGACWAAAIKYFPALALP